MQKDVTQKQSFQKGDIRYAQLYELEACVHRQLNKNHIRGKSLTNKKSFSWANPKDRWSGNVKNLAKREMPDETSEARNHLFLVCFTKVEGYNTACKRSCVISPSDTDIPHNILLALAGLPTLSSRCQVEPAVFAFKFIHRINLPGHLLDTLSHWTMDKNQLVVPPSVRLIKSVCPEKKRRFCSGLRYKSLSPHGMLYPHISKLLSLLLLCDLLSPLIYIILTLPFSLC